ncbi:hypothetical protein B0T26DRAFT_850270 [Lasiosphaeria miniovina]|uniref:ATP-dependent bile acid permease n=1 Tax=Lasiosphaeria miniovina TaxID=1954250 RepID=A0AA40AU07_9PEZI|nr:uncharacterized protein B0T26DRAFT_850270 [Lasiosphaeria miniovina]KAK0721995.1 hypothetical protein B0T26DRAFT_850270 [Lasiosphaeria miniovina]
MAHQINLASHSFSGQSLSSEWPLLVESPSFWPCYSCCKNFWIPTTGTFGTDCLGVIGHIPLWISVLVVLLRYGLGPVWRFRPQWLRRLGSEEAEAASALGRAGDEEVAASARQRPWTAWTVSVLLLTILAAACGVAGALIWPRHRLQYMVPVIPNIISSLVLVMERPRVIPGAVFVIQAALIVAELAVAVSAPIATGSGWEGVVGWTGAIGLPLASLAIMVNMPMRDPLLDTTGIAKPFEKPTASARSPEDVITLWQWMTISWVAPLIAIGYKRQLHDEDVWFLAYEFQHSRLHRLFRDIPGTVLARLFQAAGLDLLLTTGLGVLETSIQLAEPILLKQLLKALSSETPDTRTALVYAGITLFLRLVMAQSGIFNLGYCRRGYEKTRGAMITMVYEKTLRRKAFTFPNTQTVPGTIEAAAPEEQEIPPSGGTSTATTLTDDESSSDTDGLLGQSKKPRERGSWLPDWVWQAVQMVKSLNVKVGPAADSPASTGKILNIMRNDVYEVSQRFWEFQYIFTKPMNLVLSVVLIWNILGPASLSGIIVLLVGMGINAFFMRLLLRIERVRRTVTDSKLQRISQFVESIRHLRWYDWQDSWLAQIMESRRAELTKRIMSNIISDLIKTVNSMTAYMVPVAGFMAYTLISNRPMTVDIAFPALELFTTLQNALRELPDLITVLLNARVAMQRIEKFMLEPEKEISLDDNRDAEQDLARPPGPLEIEIRDASFSWPASTKKVLRHVSMVCRPGLTVVCGKVGIGKTALLSAILGELDLLHGETIVPREMIGYCAQTPWLESMSIRENILFSSIYDKARFESVIDACCLRADFETFRSKDLTLIGENGVGLSGGQRARVSLARAIYSNSRILLLDDPIAALDHHTATSIMKNLFGDKRSSLTEGRLVIFVTHRVDIVKQYAYQVLEVTTGGRVTSFDREIVEPDGLEANLAAAAEQVEGEEEDTKPAEKFIEEEHRAHGGVLISVYWEYVKAAGLVWWVGLISAYVFFRAAKVGYFWFLKEWGEQYGSSPAAARSVSTYVLGFGGVVQDDLDATASQLAFGFSPRTLHGPAANASKSWTDLGSYLPPPDENVRPWLFWFFVVSLAQVVALSLADAALIVIVYRAGKTLFEQVVRRVSNATFRFYDVTPVGRLMNRMTSDMGTVDGAIAGQLVGVAWYVLGWITSVIVIASTTPVFLMLSVIMTTLFVVIFFRFLPTSQSLRRLETVSLSPLMSNFGTLVEGLTTVRAYHAEPHFQARIVATTDKFQKMDHMYWAMQMWLQFRFDLLSALTSFTLTVTAVLAGLSGGSVGFVLAAASNFVICTHMLCRRYGDMQMQFVSVERIIELLHLEQEPVGTVKPPAAWPGYGDAIVFDHVTLRYAPHLDPVLDDVSIKIPGGSNVAVTGRTGSGKSTLALSLLGTLHPDANTGGAIHIGAINLADVDKHVLRRNITFVAQDPVLFPGTLRDNLDPLGEHEEADRASVLDRVLHGHSFTLDSPVDSGGHNLSQGQRQLIGLGRAILRRSPVIIMDEATASIDAQTADEIQRLLREELRYSTVITIAHKAEAVRDADFEVVLEKGKVLRAGPRKVTSSAS